ncbi:hypothetical protein AHF37_00377 [Paragonimus kellicotti]|nr:hypothetical protein AHF37_00377 [Paragonimus kellicotti]
MTPAIVPHVSDESAFSVRRCACVTTGVQTEVDVCQLRRELNCLLSERMHVLSACERASRDLAEKQIELDILRRDCPLAL